jgi:hypothetical protein
MRADVPFYIVQLEFRLCRLAIPDIAPLFCSVAHAKDLNLVQGKLVELAVHGKVHESRTKSVEQAEIWHQHVY